MLKALAEIEFSVGFYELPLALRRVSLSESFSLEALVIVEAKILHLALHLLLALPLDLLLVRLCLAHSSEVVIHSGMHVPFVVN